MYLNGSSSARLSVEPLVNAIFAIGCRITQEKQPSYNGNISKASSSNADDFFAVALAGRGRLLEGEPSVLKLQVRPL